MVLTIAVLCFFVSILIWVIKNKKWIVSAYIIGIYIVSLMGSIWLLATGQNYYEPTILPSILYCAFLYIFIKPFMIDTPQINGFRSDKQESTFIIIGYCISVVLIIGALFLLPLVKQALSLNLGELRAYHTENTLVPTGTIQYLGDRICSWLGNLGYVTLIIFFYSLCFLKGHYIFKTLTLISSLVPTYYAILLGGRTNLIYWVLFFEFCLLLFHSYMGKSAKLYSFIVVGAIFLVLIIYFITVTVQRATVHNFTNQDFLMSYIGQPFLNFCNFFDNFNYHPYSLRRIFPFTIGLFEGKMLDLQEYRALLYSHTGMNIGIFYTFLGDIFVDIGMVGLVIYTGLYRVVVDRFMRRNDFDISRLIVLGQIAQLLVFGLFYYSYWKYSATFALLLAILISIFLKKVNLVIGDKSIH